MLAAATKTTLDEAVHGIRHCQCEPHRDQPAEVSSNYFVPHFFAPLSEAVRTDRSADVLWSHRVREIGNVTAEIKDVAIRMANFKLALQHF